MDDAGIEPEVTVELVQQVLQNPAIAAMAVDDGKIARRQGAHHVARQIAQQGHESLDRERERAGRPVMLARQPDRHARQLPQVEVLAPARHDATREPFGHHHVGVERQMRPVLLDRSERQAEHGGLGEPA